jgi:nucleoside-diphosphate-sugar epimerase
MAFARIVAALAEGGAFALHGNASRSFTYVDDVVEATIAAMERGTGTYNVGGGVEVTMLEAIALLERIAGRELELRRHPPVAGDQRRTKADTSRIRAELGWEPSTALEDGLRAQWEWAAARVAAR